MQSKIVEGVDRGSTLNPVSHPEGDFEMASYYSRTFENAHEKLEEHLRKIKEIVYSYIADNREERRIHFDAVAICLKQYERDLEDQGVFNDDRKEFVKLLNIALTELIGYFFSFVDEDFGSVSINDESEAVIFAYFLEKGTLELRDFREPDSDTE